MLTGGCFCGRVRYETEAAPFHPTLCHCADCRRVAGAPAVAWFSVPSASLRFVAGQPHRFASSPRAVRSFCRDCGTPLTFTANATPDEVDIATCTLDDPERVPPRDHTRTSGRLSWTALVDGLPEYSGSRSEGG